MDIYVSIRYKFYFIPLFWSVSGDGKGPMHSMAGGGVVVSVR